jgi:hypothetical protein
VGQFTLIHTCSLRFFYLSMGKNGLFPSIIFVILAEAVGFAFWPEQVGYERF